MVHNTFELINLEIILVLIYRTHIPSISCFNYFCYIYSYYSHRLNQGICRGYFIQLFTVYHNLYFITDRIYIIPKIYILCWFLIKKIYIYLYCTRTLAIKIFHECRTNFSFSNTSSSLAKRFNNSHDSLGKFSHYIFVLSSKVYL